MRSVPERREEGARRRPVRRQIVLRLRHIRDLPPRARRGGDVRQRDDARGRRRVPTHVRDRVRRGRRRRVYRGPVRRLLVDGDVRDAVSVREGFQSRPRRPERDARRMPGVPGGIPQRRRGRPVERRGDALRLRRERAAAARRGRHLRRSLDPGDVVSADVRRSRVRAKRDDDVFAARRVNLRVLRLRARVPRRKARLRAVRVQVR
mmetsp:Transcript_8175/g.29870  ORF Transcript_8175/g.29870 Transcript_8175/m.29870 type:complete len:206 (+) Transcript_8175:559-1176(+)